MSLSEEPLLSSQGTSSWDTDRDSGGCCVVAQPQEVCWGHWCCGASRGWDLEGAVGKVAIPAQGWQDGVEGRRGKSPCLLGRCGQTWG